MSRLVIIDDSESTLLFMKDLMQRNLPECEVWMFADPVAGLKWCLQFDVDLVVVDYIMPKINGLSFIEAFHRDPARRDVPIVMVTTNDVKDTRYMALQLGATDFLTKPIDEVEFLTRVRNLLALSRSHRALADRATWLAGEVRKATQTLVEREREAVLVLSRAAEHRDPETGAHLVRMAGYSRLIAAGLSLSPDLVETIFAAAPMHDVGKIGLPDTILLKPDKLDADEYQAMQRHTVYGWEILRGSTSPLLQMAADIALRHHEKFDGSGYPDGLGGEDIPLVGRITALADVLDALTSVRPYKPAWHMDSARAYIEGERGRHFDPACVDSLFAAWEAVASPAPDRPPPAEAACSHGRKM